MKQFTLVLFILITFLACSNSDTSKDVNQTDTQQLVVKEVLQTSQYTYILDQQGQWVAIPSMKVELGETYYYSGGLEMSDFKSQELDRMFDEILFLEELFESPEMMQEEPGIETTGHTASVTIEKNDISVVVAEGGISIADLYSKKSSYNGKKVIVKGKVVKFNPEIMGKNWIHLQDGTEFEGQFDLTVTSQTSVNIGDVVSFEGVIALDKDFGYGYFYDVIMEEGELIPVTQ